MTVTSFEGKMPVIGEVRLGARCCIGPGARLRGDYGTIVLGDYAVVGMGAVVSDWAEVGRWGVIAEGAVVPQHAVDDEFRAAWGGFKQIYVDLCERYRIGLGA